MSDRKRIRLDSGGSDPFRSRALRAEENAFNARGRMIWIGIVLAIVLAVVGAVLLFR
jgi:hypothetical protein